MPLRISVQAQIPKGLGQWIKAMPPNIQKTILAPSVNRAMKHPLRKYKSRLKSLEWSQQQTGDLGPRAAPGHVAGTRRDRVPLWKTLGTTVVKYRNGNVFGAMGARSKFKGLTNHTHLIEFGVRPHRIRAGFFRKTMPTGRQWLVFPSGRNFSRPRKILFGAGSGQMLNVAKNVLHPGIKARRHLEIAARTTRTSMRGELLRGIRNRIVPAMRRLAKEKVRSQLRKQGLKATLTA